MDDLQNRIETLLEVFEKWLSDENEFLKRAIARTVEEEYFCFPDVKFALNAVKKSLNRTAMVEWAERSAIPRKDVGNNKNVLCLHAGNLPLVGFQDALAVLLSGTNYVGKISRKDPYLLPTFLNEVKKTDRWSSVDVQWSHRLDDFEGMLCDAILFAGSEESVPGVKEAVQDLGMVQPDTNFLIRTAHFSMAYMPDQKKENMEQLVEAIFRYGGKGCRSVAVVVSPYALDEIKCELTDYIEAFWLDNPQHEKPKPKLHYRHAYNKALERSQAWLDDFLLQQDGLELDQDFICYWIEGREEQVTKLADSLGKQLQSIYITHPEIEIPGWEDRLEFLSDAQRPPISWKPDGVDVLEWLGKNA